MQSTQAGVNMGEYVSECVCGTGEGWGGLPRANPSCIKRLTEVAADSRQA